MEGLQSFKQSNVGRDAYGKLLSMFVTCCASLVTFALYIYSSKEMLYTKRNAGPKLKVGQLQNPSELPKKQHLGNQNMTLICSILSCYW